LQKQFPSNPANCLNVLHRLHDSLYYLHQHTTTDLSGRVPKGSLRWNHFFPQFIKPEYWEGLHKVARGAWKGFAWPLDEEKVASNKTLNNREFANPFAVLTKPPSFLGNVEKMPAVSRVHGDLNLSNILVVPSHGLHPIDIILIDLADAEPDQLTAKDYAVLEAEFWREIFSKHLEKADEDHAATQFLLIRDYLEGRSDQIGSEDEFTIPCLRFVQELRKLAYQRLNPKRSGYLLDDYFRCLYFVSLGALGFESVQKSQLQKRISILAASLCLETLGDWEGGQYVGEMIEGRLPRRGGPSDQSPRP
jgi:Ternary complex associated domain 9